MEMFMFGFLRPQAGSFSLSRRGAWRRTCLLLFRLSTTSGKPASYRRLSFPGNLSWGHLFPQPPVIRPAV